MKNLNQTFLFALLVIGFFLGLNAPVHAYEARIQPLQDQFDRLYEERDLEGAKLVAEDMLEMVQTYAVTKPIRLVGPLQKLAMISYDQGDLEGAKTLYERIISIKTPKAARRQGDQITIETLPYWRKLAGLLKWQYDYEAATYIYEKMLKFQRRHGFKATDQQAERDLRNLFFLYQLQGDYEKAEEVHRKLLDVLREQLGDEHPAVAIQMKRLANLYGKQGKKEQMKRMFRKVREMQERVIPVTSHFKKMAYARPLLKRKGQWIVTQEEVKSDVASPSSSA
jgi:tetratricopeptide (TPR) repeat protein